MTARIANISFDAHDPYAQMIWWDKVLEDFHITPGEDEPGDPECGLEGPGGQAVLFLQVPEGKTVKNRLHLCLVSADGSRDDEIDRLLGLGATVVDDRRTPEGKGWMVFADPEGNEFCIVRSRAEQQADR
ncbi:MAG: VOC family protein [Williamsia herbipolensis]|nr:VOC family protein [Williamsia herbipolensis]